MTLIHEFIHAELLNRCIQLGLIHQSHILGHIAFESSPNITTGNNLNDAMHNIYDDFLSEIIDSVFKYATNNNIEGVTEEYCTKLVLGAHQNSNSFQALTDEQKNEYSTITVNEEQGNEESNGTNCN